ncbi:hypothetical protein Tco_1371673 [Tanacetum coccineum]
MIIYRMEEFINKGKGPMPFAMLLTRLYNHILTTNPQAIVPIARFILHEHVMDPLDISRNPSKEKGKKIASPSVISFSSSLSDDNESPSFLKFYDKLSDSEDLTKAQREKRGMFKCLKRYVGTITKLPDDLRVTAAQRGEDDSKSSGVSQVSILALDSKIHPYEPLDCLHASTAIEILWDCQRGLSGVRRVSFRPSRSS